MDIANGEIRIGLKDEASPELRRVEADYRAAMARISRMEAEANIKARLTEFDADIKKVKDELAILKKQRADVKLGAKHKELDDAIREAKLEVDRLNGKKAEIEIKTRGSREALADIEKVRAAEAARAAAEARYAAQRDRIATNDQNIRTRATLDMARQEEKAARLRQEWARLTDQVEKYDKSLKKTFDREVREKISVDRDSALASMERVKAEMNLMGKHPPVTIKVDTDRSEMSRVQKIFDSFKTGLASGLGKIGQGLGSIGDVRIFGNSLKTIVGVVATLAPMLVSLGGAATSLVGVLGTGLAGAAGVAGGVMSGLALNLGGVFLATKPVITQFKTAEKATQAYSAAVDKYGAKSKQARTAQKQMNNELRSVDPVVRRAVVGFAQLQTHWKQLTGGVARRDIGKVLTGGMTTLNKLMPTLARNTNSTFGILTHHLTSIEHAMGSRQGISIFDSLGRSANKFLGPALTGLTRLGAAFVHVGESAARIFAGPAGRGFAKWAGDIDRATQPGAKLDGQIRRLGGHATDLLHLFGAVGRLLLTVFNGSANAGDGLVRSMTRTVDKWNEFLNTTRGHKDMATFFGQSADNVRQLASALAPLIGAFVQWSGLLTPITTGLLKGVTFVSNLIKGFTNLIGMNGALGALGATIGVVFAVSKIGSFVGLLARAVSLMRDLGAAGTAKSLLTGRFFPSIKQRGVSAAEQLALDTAGGAAGGAAARRGETSLLRRIFGGAGGDVAGGAGAGLLSRLFGNGVSGFGRTIASGLRSALSGGGLLRIGGPIGALLAGHIAANQYLPHLPAGVQQHIYGSATPGGGFNAMSLVSSAFHAISNFVTGGPKSPQAYLSDVLGQIGARVVDLNKAWPALNSNVGTANQNFLQTTLSVKQARDALAQTRKGTLDHRLALVQLNQALDQQRQRHQDLVKAENQERTAAQAGLALARQQLADVVGLGGSERQRAAALRAVDIAQNRVAASGIEVQRSLLGMANVGPQVEQQLGALARMHGGKQLAMTLGLRIQDPRQLGRALNDASLALNAGARPSVIARVIADSRSVADLLRRLHNLRVQVVARADASQAMRDLRRAIPGINALLSRNVRVRPSVDLKSILAAIPVVQNLFNNINPTISANSSVGSVVPGIQQALGSLHGTNVSIDGQDNTGQAISSAQHSLGSVKDRHTVIDAADKTGPGAGSAKRTLGSVKDRHAHIDAANLTIPGVRAAAQALGSVKDRHAHITANANQAIPVIGAVQAALNSLHSKNISVSLSEVLNTVPGFQQIAHALHIPGFAKGGEATKGGMYDKPTFLVGEENRPEYVIATNPAYRQQNLKHLTAAAEALGVSAGQFAGAYARGGMVPKRVAPPTIRASADMAAHKGASPANRVVSGANSPFQWRGVVEGQYGGAWSHNQRDSFLDWMGRHGFNAFINAPKSDPTGNADWRTPYSSDQMAGFTEEIARAARQGIKWIPNIGPARSGANDIVFSSDDDVAAAVAKFTPFIQAGAKQMLVSFDDTSGTLSDPRDIAKYGGTGPEAAGKATVDYLNRLLSALHGVDKQVSLMTVPKAYTGVQDSAYRLGMREGRLDPSVQVMWTGASDSPRYSAFSANDAQTFAQQTGTTRPVVWANWANTDAGIKANPGGFAPPSASANDISGFFFNVSSNPLSNIPQLASAADYMDDPSSYDSAASWRAGLAEAAATAGYDIAPAAFNAGTKRAGTSPSQVGVRAYEALMRVASTTAKRRRHKKARKPRHHKPPKKPQPILSGAHIRKPAHADTPPAAATGGGFQEWVTDSHTAWDTRAGAINANEAAITALDKPYQRSASAGGRLTRAHNVAVATDLRNQLELGSKLNIKVGAPGFRRPRYWMENQNKYSTFLANEFTFVSNLIRGYTAAITSDESLIGRAGPNAVAPWGSGNTTAIEHWRAMHLYLRQALGSGGRVDPIGSGGGQSDDKAKGRWPLLRIYAEALGGNSAFSQLGSLASMGNVDFPGDAVFAALMKKAYPHWNKAGKRVVSRLAPPDQVGMLMEPKDYWQGTRSDMAELISGQIEPEEALGLIDPVAGVGSPNIPPQTIDQWLAAHSSQWSPSPSSGADWNYLQSWPQATLGKTAADAIAQLTLDYSLAQDPTNTLDNPNTAVDEHADNLTRIATWLKGFYGNLLGQAMSEGAATDIQQQLSDAKNQWQQTADGTVAATATQGAQAMALSDARYNLFTSMGSNFVPLWTQAPNRAASALGAGAFGPSPAAGASTTNVTVNNSFQSGPADPHTWSNSLGFELRAAI